MGIHGCRIDGNLDESRFSEPLPWVGLYVAVASLLCSLAMVADAYVGFRRKKLWFPCKFFSMNATTLTLLSIVAKLPVDLNTAMPRRQDQLTKLSSTVLICTAMGNFMPSLGTMEDSEILANAVALAIFVITIVVNIGIQIGTGVIYVFIPEHAVIMFLMLALLLILGFSALTVPTTKQLMQQQHKIKKRQASFHSGLDKAAKAESFAVTKLKDEVKMYWMMAYTSSPQHVMSRSVTSTASGAFCLISALILVEAVVRSLQRGFINFCSGESDYKWSCTVVLVSQGIGVGAGTIAPAIRWFHAISIRCHKSGKWSSRDDLRVESYWVRRLVECKESLLPFNISTRYCRKVAHVSRNQILDVLICIQTAVVLVSKFIRLSSILTLCFLGKLLSPFHCKRLRRKLRLNGSVFRGMGAETVSGSTPDLSDFVLHLEGEEGLVQLIMRRNCEAIEKWIEKGRKHQPTYLLDLLKNSTVSRGFKGVAEFDSDHIPPIGSEKPPNCWALPLVTLTSIAVALPNIDHKMIKSLFSGVNEGLRLIRLIETSLDKKGLTRVREAADMVWLGIDLHKRWLDEDLHKIKLEEKCAVNVIEKLTDIGKKHVLEFTAGEGKDKKPVEWPARVLAANSMYRIGQTVLQDYKGKLGMDGTLIEWLQATIADIFAACLTNLPRVILLECTCSAIEVRAARVAKAAYLLGEAENILMKLGQHAFPDLDPNCMACIDEWRFSKQKHLPCLPSELSDYNNCGFTEVNFYSTY